MKSLLILRHAKSDWGEPGLEDQQRLLNKRGRKAAPKMGRLLREKNLLPELVLSSTAVRARTTAELVAEASGYQGKIELLESLYAAPPEAYIVALSALPDTIRSVMVVGHNPGLEELLQDLTGKYEPLSTAALAYVRLPIESWAELADDAAGELVHVWRPREI
jgi:phosphohistidine phosphatase